MNAEQERAEFEWWASDEGEYPQAVERVGECYKLAQIQSYWIAWQARAALQSQDRDALRYRFIRSIVSASNALGRGSWRFHYDRLPKPLNNPMKGSVAQHFDEAIDLASRVEGSEE